MQMYGFNKILLYYFMKILSHDRKFENTLNQMIVYIKILDLFLKNYFLPVP
jgi:hypothetical protein